MLTDIGQFSELCLSPLLYISPQQPCADAAAENTCHRDCQGIQSEDRKSSDNLRIAAYLYAEQEQKQPDQYRNGLGRPRTVTLSQKRSDDDTAQHETYDSKHIPINYYPILNVIKPDLLIRNRPVTGLEKRFAVPFKLRKIILCQCKLTKSFPDVIYGLSRRMNHVFSIEPV